MPLINQINLHRLILIYAPIVACLVKKESTLK